MLSKLRHVLCLVVLLLPAPAVADRDQQPHILVISVDTLRADRMGSYGYSRKTSPHIDGLLARGARFADARTVEPLTAPALASMLTSLPPHEHGSTRNGLRVRPELPSLPKVLRRHGYKTGAFVGSWTLREKLWAMADHFDHFEEVLNKARWLGLVKREATAEDLNEAALDWFSEQIEGGPSRPVFLWVHYVEPHAPYVLQRDFMNQIGASPDDNNYSDSNKYDSEIAYVDFQISKLLKAVGDLAPKEDTLVVFVSDHGESLGEHGYWGHGRHLYEPTLQIPMGITWPGHVEPRVVEAPALIIDLAPTLVGLLGIEVPDFFQGMDWSKVFVGAAREPHDRVTLYQAHRGSVGAKEDQTKVREKGLLEVARLEDGKKEILRVTNGRRRVFDLVSDPAELESLVLEQSEVSADLQIWLDRVMAALILADELPPPSLSDEDMDALRALGYLE